MLNNAVSFLEISLKIVLLIKAKVYCIKMLDDFIYIQLGSKVLVHCSIWRFWYLTRPETDTHRSLC